MIRSPATYATPPKWGTARRLAEPLNFMHLLLTAAVCWWTILLYSGHLKFSQRPVPFGSFIQLFSQTTWDVIFTTVCLVGFLGLFRPKWCRVSTQVLSLFHCSIGILIATSDFWTTGTGLYSLLGVFSGYLAWKRR